MFNFTKYFELVNKYKDKKQRLQAINNTLNDEVSQLHIERINTTYFDKLDKQLKDNNMYFYENMLINKSIKKDQDMYREYLKKLFSRDFRDDEIRVLLSDMGDNITVIQTFDKILKDLINSYSDNLIYLGDDIKIKYVKIHFRTKIIKTLKKHKKDQLMSAKTKIQTKLDFYKAPETDTTSLDMDAINKTINIFNSINYEQIPQLNVKYEISDAASRRPTEIPTGAASRRPTEIPTGAASRRPTVAASRRLTSYKGGGDEELKEDNYNIRNALTIQEKLGNSIIKMIKKIDGYFKRLYDIYYFNIFMINKPKYQNYSLFVLNGLTYEFLEEFQLRILGIPNLKKDKYNVVLEIIKKMQYENTDNKILDVSGNLKLMLMLNKMNILLRQHINNVEINKELVINNVNDIFLAGNRQLQNFVLYYHIHHEHINMKIKILGQILYNFFASNMYEINDIELYYNLLNNEFTSNISFNKYDDILLTNIYSDISRLGKFKMDIIMIEINKKYKYYVFLNNSPNISIIMKYLVLKIQY
jgi:hypothetical protein